MKRTISLLTPADFSNDLKTKVAENVLSECDLDGDKRITYAEFEHVISRAQDVREKLCRGRRPPC